MRDAELASSASLTLQPHPPPTVMIWNNGLVFRDRRDAGRQLAACLKSYAGPDTIVLGLPRGGIVVAFEVARVLGAPLDVLTARKIGAPGHEELGIGAVAPGGVRVLDDSALRCLGITAEQLEQITEAAGKEMERRDRRFRDGRPAPALRDRTVIIVDDGLATGVTARAAARAIRSQGPRRLILALPVCASETAASFRSEVDEVVCLSTPADFRAVGLWYEDFEQVSEEEVIELLDRARKYAGAGDEG